MALDARVVIAATEKLEESIKTLSENFTKSMVESDANIEEVKQSITDNAEKNCKIIADAAADIGDIANITFS